MNEALLQSLVRLVTGRELNKLCPNCGSPAANFSFDGDTKHSNGPGHNHVTDVWVGCGACSETLVVFSLDALLAALNRTI